jgi:uncharacterized protein (DUF885 family)
MKENSTDQFFKSTVLGHPAGLFVLFFTEMWERFSFYGMRALLVMFFTSTIANGGWDWTREQAIKYSLANEAESEASIIPEIERYMAIPGQALSYKIGQLKIMELRKKAETKMGTKFDIKKFHEKVLESGVMPLALLEQKINEWVEGK